ncbi:MAG: hypothetical protein HQL70_11600 [Magnetococcales bacterium]|nr:hypothetical protein [Magnetococcales bacterium]
MPTLQITSRWIASLQYDVGQFMANLQVPGQSGHFLPCLNGANLVGQKAALGFSCFALKIYYTLGLWEQIPETQQKEWLEFICSYQVLDPENNNYSSFIDPHLLAGIAPYQAESIKTKLRRWLRGEARRNMVEDAIKAETKQAIATLAQVGAAPNLTFSQFPHNQAELLQRLNQLPWNLPWVAGGQSAAIAVFVTSQAHLIDSLDSRMLIETTSQFFTKLADPATGGYFRGETPARGQLINGAMKVLNSLDWLKSPIHYPEKLIDTCLEQGPPPAGCHVVDWVYVVHRCLLQTQHRKKEIQQRCLEIAQMIKTHQNSDKGLSYKPGKAQSNYYGATISAGLDEGDIHGTCLLTWAIAMIVEILEMDMPGWKVIRP